MEPHEKTKLKLLEFMHMKTAGTWSSNIWWWRSLTLLSITALATRLIGLDQLPGTSWDEVHFGGFGNKYINRTFFHDVHPPLGKMFVAAALRVTGYQGTFPFDVNSLYPTDFHYALVRAVFGVLGAALVPLAFLTVWQLTESLPASLLSGIAILSDHYTHRITTLILLDGPLLIAILSAVCCSFALHRANHIAWSWRWWGLLLGTGTCLGVVMSIKYVGVFTVLFVGLHTVFQLCIIVTDPAKPIWMVVPHTAARAFCLIILPILLYLATFVLHFAILSKWNPKEGGFYHSRFTASFDNTEFDDKFIPKFLEYGANISMKNSMAMSGYLESWYDLFPSEFTAPCQQITLSTLGDEEILTWTLRYVNVSAGQVEDIPGGVVVGGRRVLRNGDHVVFTHRSTGRSMRTHGHRAAITKRHFQVCGYGDDGEAGPFETWQILVPGLAKGVPVEALKVDFMLKNYQMKCFLSNPGNTPLPKAWAFETAKEVTCTKNTQAQGLLWHINWVNQTRMPLTKTHREYSMTLWEKIVEQHHAMILGNSGLRPTEDELINSARPWGWPIMYRGQVLSVYDNDRIARHFNASTADTASPNATLVTAAIPSVTPSDAYAKGSTGGFSTLSSSSPTPGIVSTVGGGVQTKVKDQLLSSSLSLQSQAGKDNTESTASLQQEGRNSSTDGEKPTNGSGIVSNDILIQSTPKKVAIKSKKKPSTETYGIFMNNPILAYLNLITFVLALILFLYHFYHLFRKTEEPEGVYARRQRTVSASFWIITCWALHYLPFFTMTRILYTHHYCPAYCYSCMLTGIILGHLCESAASWLSPRRKDLLLTVLFLVPAGLFLVSYWLLFPLATSLEGRFGHHHPGLGPYFQKLHLGQLWFELGFEADKWSPEVVSVVDKFEKTNMNNPDLNATLYYATFLDYRPVASPDIRPVAASNYSSWRHTTGAPSVDKSVHKETRRSDWVDSPSSFADHNIDISSTGPESDDRVAEEDSSENEVEAESQIVRVDL